MHPSRAGLLALACSALAVGEVDAYGVPAWTSRPPFLRTSAPLCAAAAMGSDAPVASTMTTTSTTAKQAPRKANVDDWVTLWRLSKPDLPLIAVAFAALLIAAAGSGDMKMNVCSVEFCNVVASRTARASPPSEVAS